MKFDVFWGLGVVAEQDPGGFLKFEDVRINFDCPHIFGDYKTWGNSVPLVDPIDHITKQGLLRLVEIRAISLGGDVNTSSPPKAIVGDGRMPIVKAANNFHPFCGDK